MKKILPLLFISFSFIFYGCNKHQYVFVEGDQDYSYTNEYLIENDSLEILYNFSGNSVPVHIKVKNKSNKPLFIDWKKSAAVIDGKKYSYWNDDSNVEISGFGDVYFAADGSIVKEERITYVPPKSYIETTRIFLQTAFFKDLPERNLQHLKMSSENGPVKVKKYIFSEANSPLSFRSIITVSNQESFSKETMFDNTFWVAEVLESSHEKLIRRQHINERDFTQLHHSSSLNSKTDVGKVGGTITLLSALVGLFYLSSEGSEAE